MKMLRTAIIGMVLVTAGSAPLPSQRALETQRIEQEKMRIAERQKRLVEDMDKLLVLTTALKEQVDQSNKDILSVDMIKKAEEIEKLAHSVKERIKG